MGNIIPQDSSGCIGPTNNMALCCLLFTSTSYFGRLYFSVIAFFCISELWALLMIPLKPGLWWHIFLPYPINSFVGKLMMLYRMIQFGAIVAPESMQSQHIFQQGYGLLTIQIWKSAFLIHYFVEKQCQGRLIQVFGACIYFHSCI